MSESIKPPTEIRSAEDLERILDVTGQMTDEFRNDRDRPYDGQPQTSLGERGKTIVEGLTMRDVHDCIIMGMISASTEGKDQDKVGDMTWCANDVYKLPWDEMDPIACVQNAMCNIEKMMGIYPNVPKLLAEREETRDE